MRALVVATVLLTTLGLHALHAEDKGKPSPSGQSQDHSNASVTPAPQASSDDQTRRTMNRMGPGIDWDHRKAGRHWRISPHHPEREPESGAGSFLC
jgi:hypothetical protein